MTVRLRQARFNDGAAMASLEARAASHPWSENQYAESIASHQCWVLENDSQLIGLLVFTRIVDEAELFNIAIDPAFQGQGYANQLMQFLLEQNRGHAGKIFLEVRESNTAAIGLYQRCGFAVSGRRKEYYPAHNGREDALMMSYEYR